MFPTKPRPCWPLWPIPIDFFDAPTRFGTTHVHAYGPVGAPSLLLLPGQAISSTMWYPNIEALIQFHRVYAPDILGDMGKSFSTRPFKQQTEFADWLIDLCDELQLAKIDVAGLSYGGFIALRLALAAPERVRKLVLMAPANLLALRPRFFLRLTAMLLPAFVLSLEAKGRVFLRHSGRGMACTPKGSVMLEQVITTLEQVNTEWLTTVLNRSGALTRGAVQGFDVDIGQGNWSSNARLTIQYAAASQGTLPHHLFLKLVNTDLEDEFFGPSEVFYYTHDYVDVADAPLIRCYDAAYSEEQHCYHLLLDDVSVTHVTAGALTPTLDYGLALAEAFAILHARWWSVQRLASAGAPRHDAQHIQRFVNIAEPGVEHIITHCAAALKPHWPDLMRDFFAHHPAKMIVRAQDATGFTLIHGDAGPYNIMVPRNGSRPLYLIDRQPFDWSLTTWLGVYDLAFAIVLDWDSESRRHLEIPVLQHYYQHLLRRGVTDYTWEQVWEDYRLAAAMGIYIATEYCRGGLNVPAQRYWLPRLQKALTACDDLACAELWQKT